MLNISDELKEKLLLDSIHKELVIPFDDEHSDFRAVDIVQESMTLEESLCSESTLKVGACEASSFEVQTRTVDTTVLGSVIRPYLIIDKKTDLTVPLGVFKISDVELSDDRSTMTITAYDVMSEILQKDVSAWYDNLFSGNTKSYTLKQFRDSFFSHIGVEQVATTLANDSMTILKTIEPNGQLSGGKVITAICEINGVFGHINRYGKMEYKDLTKAISALYPSDDLYPEDTLFPADCNGMMFPPVYNIKTVYADYECLAPNRVIVRQEEGDIGGSYPTNNQNNPYVIEDNFLAYGHSDLGTVAHNIYDCISDISYTPCEHDCKGYPAIEVGDTFVAVIRGNQIVKSICLRRVLKGVQALHDRLEAQGDEYYPTKATSVQKTIYQLQKQVNILTRELGLFRSEIYKELQTIGEENEDNIYKVGSMIEQTADHITTSVSESGTFGDWYLENKDVKFTTNNFDYWNEEEHFPYSTANTGDYVLDTSTGLLRVIITMTKEGHQKTKTKHYDISAIIGINSSDYSSAKAGDYIIRPEEARVQQVDYVGKNSMQVKGIDKATYYVSDIDYFRPDYSTLAVNQTVLDSKGDIYTITSISKNSHNAGNAYQLQRVSTKTSTEITQTANSIVSTAVKTETDRASGAETNLSSKIDQTATSITTTVSQTYETKTDATTKQTNLQSQITQNANNISLKVSKTGIVGDLNSQMSGIDITSNSIAIKTTGTFTVDSTYFDLTANGTMTCTGGTIGGWTIDGSSGIKRTGSDSWGSVTTTLDHSGMGFSSTKCDTKYGDDGIKVGVMNRGSTINYGYMDCDHLQLGNTIIAREGSGGYTTHLVIDSTTDSSNRNRKTKSDTFTLADGSKLRFVNGLLCTAPS